MASTYTWANLLTFVKPYVRDMPTSTIDVQACDRVNRIMWKHYFWNWSIADLTSISLTNAVQDYTIADSDFYRIYRVRVTQTNTTTNRSDEKQILEFLPPELELQGSLYDFRTVSIIKTTTVRLDRAAEITGTVALQIDGEYQTVPTKITATSDVIVFSDDYADVASEGLKWAYMVLRGDDRGGGIVYDKRGMKQYTGQYAVFMGMLDDAAQAEDFGNANAIRFPDNPLGATRASGPGLFWGG
jgi:hypothetical protein